MNTRIVFPALFMLLAMSVYAGDSRRFIATGADKAPTAYPPGIDADVVSLVLDDGSLETGVGIGGGQWFWLNRFTPDPGAFPFELNSVEVYWWSLYGPVVGALFDIYIYEDTDGDGDPGTGATWLATYHAAVQVLDAFSTYSIPPVTLNGPGDVLVAVVNRTVGIGSSDFPAAFDQTTTQRRSWAGIYFTDPPDPPPIPADALWGLLDDFGLPGNWMIRAYGESGAIDPCMDFTSLIACCDRTGLIRSQVTLLNNISHTGENVTFDIDGNLYNAVIEDNGTHSRARISAAGYGLGDHTVALADPMGCFDPITVTCSSRLSKAEVEWEAADALWAGSTKATVRGDVPAATMLLGNYPNPFNPSTTIRYALSASTRVSVRVYNMLGQEIATLFDGVQNAGEQSVVWNGTNKAGQSVASGLYVYRVQAGDLFLTGKMLFAK